MRPEARGESLVVRHQGGERDEDERRHEGDRRSDQQAVVRHGDQEALAANARRQLSANERHGDLGGAHLSAPAAWCTQRRELTTITSVTANETTRSSTAIA